MGGIPSRKPGARPAAAGRSAAVPPARIDCADVSVASGPAPRLLSPPKAGKTASASSAGQDGSPRARRSSDLRTQSAWSSASKFKSASDGAVTARASAGGSIRSGSSKRDLALQLGDPAPGNDGSDRSHTLTTSTHASVASPASLSTFLNRTAAAPGGVPSNPSVNAIVGSVPTSANSTPRTPRTFGDGRYFGRGMGSPRPAPPLRVVADGGSPVDSHDTGFGSPDTRAPPSLRVASAESTVSHELDPDVEALKQSMSVFTGSSRGSLRARGSPSVRAVTATAADAANSPPPHQLEAGSSTGGSGRMTLLAQRRGSSSGAEGSPADGGRAQQPASEQRPGSPATTTTSSPGGGSGGESGRAEEAVAGAAISPTSTATHSGPLHWLNGTRRRSRARDGDNSALNGTAVDTPSGVAATVLPAAASPHIVGSRDHSGSGATSAAATMRSKSSNLARGGSGILPLSLSEGQVPRTRGELEGQSESKSPRMGVVASAVGFFLKLKRFSSSVRGRIRRRRWQKHEEGRPGVLGGPPILSPRPTMPPPLTAVQEEELAELEDMVAHVRRVVRSDDHQRGTMNTQTPVRAQAVTLFLSRESCSAHELQRVLRTCFIHNQDVEFYETAATLLIRKGEPLLAYDMLKDAHTQLMEAAGDGSTDGEDDGEKLDIPGLARVQQLSGFALAQAGSTMRAIGVLEGLLEDLHDRGALTDSIEEETEGVLSRCYKDLAMRAANPDMRRELLERAYEGYSRSYESQGKTSYYTGINAATMALMLGKDTEAITRAIEVERLCEQELRDAMLEGGSSTDENMYWVLATMGEAAIIRGNFERAAKFYRRAVKSANKNYFMLSSTKRQMKMLLAHRQLEVTDTPRHRPQSPLSASGSNASHQARNSDTKHACIADVKMNMATYVDEVTHLLFATHQRARGVDVTPRHKVGSVQGSDSWAMVHHLSESACRVLLGLLAAPRSTKELGEALAVEVTSVLAHGADTKHTLKMWVSRHSVDMASAPAETAMEVLSSRFHIDNDALRFERCSQPGAADAFNPATLLNFVFNIPAVGALVAADTLPALIMAPGSEDVLRARITATVSAVNVGFLFTSLCTVSDVMFCEAILAGGGEVFVVLPVPVDKHLAFCDQRFRAHEVLDAGLSPDARAQSRASSRRSFHAGADDGGGAGGAGGGAAATTEAAADAGATPAAAPPSTPAISWGKRLRAVLAAASKVSVANDLALRGVSNTNKHYASLILYGMALMKAKTMDAKVVRLFLKPQVLERVEASQPEHLFQAAGLPPTYHQPSLRDLSRLRGLSSMSIARQQSHRGGPVWRNVRAASSVEIGGDAARAVPPTNVARGRSFSHRRRVLRPAPVVASVLSPGTPSPTPPPASQPGGRPQPGRGRSTQSTTYSTPTTLRRGDSGRVVRRVSDATPPVVIIPSATQPARPRSADGSPRLPPIGVAAASAVLSPKSVPQSPYAGTNTSPTLPVQLSPRPSTAGHIEGRSPRTSYTSGGAAAQVETTGGDSASDSNSPRGAKDWVAQLEDARRRTDGTGAVVRGDGPASGQVQASDDEDEREGSAVHASPGSDFRGSAGGSVAGDVGAEGGGEGGEHGDGGGGGDDEDEDAANAELFNNFQHAHEASKLDILRALDTATSAGSGTPYPSSSYKYSDIPAAVMQWIKVKDTFRVVLTPTIFVQAPRSYRSGHRRSNSGYQSRSSPKKGRHGFPHFEQAPSFRSFSHMMGNSERTIGPDQLLERQRHPDHHSRMPSFRSFTHMMGVSERTIGPEQLLERQRHEQSRRHAASITDHGSRAPSLRSIPNLMGVSERTIGPDQLQERARRGSQPGGPEGSSDLWSTMNSIHHQLEKVGSSSRKPLLGDGEGGSSDGASGRRGSALSTVSKADTTNRTLSVPALSEGGESGSRNHPSPHSSHTKQSGHTVGAFSFQGAVGDQPPGTAVLATNTGSAGSDSAGSSPPRAHRSPEAARKAFRARSGTGSAASNISSNTGAASFHTSSGRVTELGLKPAATSPSPAPGSSPRAPSAGHSSLSSAMAGRAASSRAVAAPTPMGGAALPPGRRRSVDRTDHAAGFARLSSPTRRPSPSPLAMRGGDSRLQHRFGRRMSQPGVGGSADAGSWRPHKQVMMAILFADIVGYSKLGEAEVLAFIHYFLGSVANLISSHPKSKQPKVKNTWGDAFYFVFEEVVDAAEFALELSDLVTNTAWDLRGLPSNLNIRISLHAAPVFKVVDPVINQVNYTGVHTSRAARIEPITPPGSVYCSQAFAAIVETLKGGTCPFQCQYVGNVPLPKGYGLVPVFVIQWAEDHHSGIGGSDDLVAHQALDKVAEAGEENEGGGNDDAASVPTTSDVHSGVSSGTEGDTLTALVATGRGQHHARWPRQQAATIREVDNETDAGSTVTARTSLKGRGHSGSRGAAVDSSEAGGARVNSAGSKLDASRAAAPPG